MAVTLIASAATFNQRNNYEDIARNLDLNSFILQFTIT